DGVMVVDDFSLFFGFLFAGVAGMVVLASVDFLERSRFPAEYVALVLAAAAGMMLMASSLDLIAIFIALELQAIAFYIMVAFTKNEKSAEAALKYLLLGAISSAITLYGMAYLFGLSGSTALDEIAAFVRDADSSTRSGLVVAAVLLTAGFGFKMAVVPFQMWVPDVYEGAPTPVTAYLSVASKAAGFAVVMRIFLVALGEGAISSDWAVLFAVLAAISMSVGNIAALMQSNVKRMLGYSSIAQAGTFLIGLAAVAASDPQLLLGTSSVIFFLGTYAFTNLGAFVAIIAISNKIGSDQIEDYAGVAKRSPMLAGGLTACLVSLTGIPPTAGFVAKLYIFDAAVQADLVWLAIIGVLNSVISAYYYLRVVLNMYTRDPAEESTFLPSPYLSVALAVSVIGLFVIGVYPSLLIEASESAANVFA
ncbi:MAG: NADH-quinone oxidoreductase subunit N, partial [Dehalococcoidia bacterium]